LSPIPGRDPNGSTGPLIGYSHSEALGRIHDGTVVIHRQNEEAVRRAQPPFHAIEVVSLPWLDRIHAWCFRRIFKNNYRSQVLTAFNYLFCLAFEWRAWRQTRSRIRAGGYDVVLRLLPVSSGFPSLFAFFFRRGPIPFVIGPINGGLPWPPGFTQADKQKEWISGLRNFYRFLPFARSTYRNASAILAASSHTYDEFASYADKLFFVPGENGINPGLYPTASRNSRRDGKLELIFVGALVPYKACDLALRASASLLQAGRGPFPFLWGGPISLSSGMAPSVEISSNWQNLLELIRLCPSPERYFIVKSYSVWERPISWSFHQFASLEALWCSKRWPWVWCQWSSILVVPVILFIPRLASKCLLSTRMRLF